MAEKIGIFGGSFNPIHNGHLNSLRTVMKKNKLSRVFVVPNNQNPLRKTETDMPSAKDRIEMVKRAIKDEKNVFVDDQEVTRGGPSYSIETIRYYESKFGSENIYFIMGADSFQDLDQWKNFEDILKSTNIIVTTRPQSELPFEIEEFPKGVQPFIRTFEPNGVAKLKTGRQISYTQLDDLDISATQIRKRLKLGRSADQFISFEVEQYIKEQDLYAPLKNKIPDFATFTQFCAQVLFDRKAIGVKGFDLTNMAASSEYTLIASGTSTRQTAAFAEQIVRAVKEEFNVLPLSYEGEEEGRWVLLDYGALIIHLFYDFVRQEYRLEDLWKDGKDMQLTDKKPKK